MNAKGGNRNIPSPKITILGVGNELLSDEGVGIHTIKELQKREFPPGIEVLEGGTDGFGLINIITSTDHLIVIDSLKGGGKPGSIYRFHIDDAPSCPDLFKTSVHQIGILEVINLSSLIGNTPDTIVIGVEPKELKTGMALSPEIKNKIPRIIELILDEIKNISEIK
jgi:hydrogenase maturation protease